jgi:diadenosine tetraphosphate (Ap4A) HIT family hydrolase
MSYATLKSFLERDMRMSHVYQPVMLRLLLTQDGKATVAEIARALLSEDRSQLEYYSEITKTMPGRVLTARGVVRREGNGYVLEGASELSDEERTALVAVCEQKLADYVAKRGDAIWQHRRQSAGYVSGTLRYEVLKSAKFRCELCGVSGEERALEVDHIQPRNKGGSDEPFNLQALCYSCNAMKRDRDDEDFRAVRASLDRREPDCPFCDPAPASRVLENSLAVVLRDAYPVSPDHLLVIPRRHVADYFELGMPEVRACQQLLREAERQLRADRSVTGVNVGVNCGEDAGQTVGHVHVHLIPRRRGDTPDPRGGVRGVIPGRQNYLSPE